MFGLVRTRPIPLDGACRSAVPSELSGLGGLGGGTSSQPETRHMLSVHPWMSRPPLHQASSGGLESKSKMSRWGTRGWRHCCVLSRHKILASETAVQLRADGDSFAIASDRRETACECKSTARDAPASPMGRRRVNGFIQVTWRPPG